jgi:phosphate transport system permease protein
MRRRYDDIILAWVARLAALTIAGMLLALLVVLVIGAGPAISSFGGGFVVTDGWRPNALERTVRDAEGYIVRDEEGEPVIEIIEPVFGALPVVYGTVVSSAIALVIAVPLSLGAALFLTRIAPKVIVGPISFLIEFLAAIPSIAYGLWGLFVLAPLLQNHVQPGIKSLLENVPGLHWMFVHQGRELPLTGKDMLAGGLILAVMIVPIITAVSRDVLRAVPRLQIEGTLALGATWWQSCAEMLCYSRSGLFGAAVLGLARAAGETMAVTMVIGNNNSIVPSPFAPAQTMSSLLANEFAEAADAMHRSALIYVALILLLMSLTFNIIARYLVVGKGSQTSAAH